MSINSETLIKIKQQLHSAQNVTGSVSSDLYNHLTEVFSRIVQYHQYDAYDKFEEISTLVKKTHMNFSDPRRDCDLNASKAGDDSAASERNAWIKQSKDLLNEVNAAFQNQQRIAKLETVVPNLDEEAEMLEWAGISFGQEFNYKLSKSLKRLASLSGASSLRFCGKIFGTKKDYWIVCGTLNHVEEPNQDKSVEPRGSGVNAQVYWVSDNILNDWIQLPECRPEYVVCARMIRHVLTGDLNASIDSNPPFPGKERHFLRAQLARIFAATSLCPQGMYEIDEETNAMKMVEDYAVPPMEELNSLEKWSNLNAAILNSGNTKHIAPAGLNAEDSEAWLAEANEKEAPVERFRILQEHTPMPGPVKEGQEPQPAWIARVVGDQQQYNQTGGKEGTVSYAVNVLKSLKWPGAITVSKCGKFTSIYVGYGLKKGDASMNPTEPPEVQQDPEDDEEMPEPTPLHAPQEPPEPDTDAAPKDDEDDDA